MTSNKLVAVALSFMAACLHAQAQATLTFGQVTSGTIGTVGQTNSYTFAGNPGDVIDFTIYASSGGLSPSLKLTNSSGSTVASANTSGCSSADVEMNSVTLAAMGTYTLVVGDCSGSHSGTYEIYAQRVNNPGSPVSALTFGQAQSNTITTAAQSNTFQFSASANDVVDFTVTTTSGSVSPRIRLYSPAGALLADQANRNAFGACSGGSVIELNAVTLAASGTYTVLVGDCGDTATGAYEIYAQRVNNPANPITLLWGQKQSSTIGLAAYSDTYTSNGATGDSIAITATTTAGNLSPRIRLYSPAGALLADQANRNAFGACSGGSVIELNAVTLAASGTYTVLVGDCGDTATGNYTLTTQCSRANSSGKCTDPLFLPNTKYFHGTEVLSWVPPSVGTASASASLTLSGPIAQTLGTGLGTISSFSWDTTTVPDGHYQLTLTFLSANGVAVATATKNVLVNNSVVWHSGTLTTSQTWTADKVQGIDGNLIIPSGVTVTIEPGTILKVVPGVNITVQSGGVLNALGTDTASIIFTSIYDSSVGGDTMLDGGTDNPSSGEWDGVTVQGTGQFNTNSDTDLNYWQSVQSGTIAASEIWSGTQVYEVTANVVVPSGVTLTIQPGTIIKFNANTGITVQSGGSLIANGTVAQPIYFTSINDDSVGGDTNGNGNLTSPAAGDWGSITIEGANASFNHVQMSYGGGPVSTTPQVIGVIQTNGAAQVTIANSFITQSFWDGILTGYPSGGDVVTVSNSVVDAVEGRGVNAWPGSTVHVVNDTFDNDGVGVFIHGGTVNIANTIISSTTGTNGWGAVTLCCGGNLSSLSYSDVWANTAGVANYDGVADPTGSNGNISANPVYVNEAQGNYRLNYGSPAIDAADGLVANYSFTDIMGDGRYSDPEVPSKTGIPDSNGNYPDMGAYEFVQNAVSTIDFTVTSVTGPESAITGSQVQVTWTDTNIGSGTAVGPWHDSVYLVQDPDTNPVELFAAQVLVGSGVNMGPGASTTNTATIRVPGSTVGNQRWEVRTNTAGDIFEGQNTANNMGLSLGYVAIDLPELQVNGPGVSNSFAAAGQSWWYKLVPGAGNTVAANLGLTGNSGSVQLFVGQGYVPTPQQFDIQQQQWNSPSVSAEIPNTSTQIYYVTAYAQTLPSTPAAFSISAVSQQFSLTSVQPNSIVSGGNATIEFIGAELTASASYQIVAGNGATYTANTVDVSDSAHVYATFAASGLATGTYNAQVTENGSTLSLKNAITVTAASSQPVTSGQIAYDIQVPDAVRAGYGGLVTINYQNTGSDDVVAPLMVLTTTGAATTFVAPLTGALSPNFATQYTAIAGQGQLLGINQTGGPVGVLPAGASGSISMDFTAGTGSDVQFGLYTVTDPAAIINWASASSSMQPSWVSSGAWSAIFANFTANVGATWGQYNATLANDATYLGQLGIQEYRVSQLQSFELMKAGLNTISQRYFLGAFGYGASHPFDIWAESTGGSYLVHYPNGAVRAFIPNPSTPGQFIGGIGDYATLAYNSTNESIQLTEKSGIIYYFLPDPNNTLHVLLDYIQDLNGNRLTAAYTHDLVTSVTSSDGDTLSFTYDGNGRITQSVDPVGRVTTYTYDSADQRLLSIINSAGTTSMAYITGQGAAEENALESVTWPDNTHTYYGYDTQGRLINIQKDGGAQPLNLTYAPTGAITITDAFNNSWQLSPDESGSLAQLLDPLGSLTQIFYDPEEKLIRAIGADGSRTSLTYDSNGNPTGEVDPLGNQLTTSFAANGDLLSLTDALGDTTQYGYDSHYNATSITYPDTRKVQATYDSRGNILTWTNRRGQTISYTWNSNNLLTQEVHSSGATSSYTYDSHRNLQSVSDATGTTNFSYDSADRITQVTYPSGRFVKYAYNSGGQRASLSDQTGYTVNYSYDSVGRLSQLTSASAALIVSYTYDSDGRLSQKNLGNGAYTTYAYDAAGNVLHLINYSSSSTINSRFDYTYDATGRKITMTTLSGQWQYSYDADGQLTSVVPPAGSSVQYSYDAAGNRITTITGGATTNYSVNNLNQYTTVGGFLYSYDVDGNLISKQTSVGTWTYTYDDEGHLLTASGPGGNWTYQYDSLGNRISSVNGSTTTQYLVDPTGIGSVEGEFDGSGNLVSHFANGLGLESTAPASGNADFYQFDDSGNTATVTGAGGSVLDAYTFLPYGEKLATSGTASNPFTYVGQFGVADEADGLYYMRARYYDPSVGRFVSEDPNGLAGGINLYRYARNSPANRWDPLGLKDTSNECTDNEEGLAVALDTEFFVGGSLPQGGLVSSLSLLRDILSLDKGGFQPYVNVGLDTLAMRLGGLPGFVIGLEQYWANNGPTITNWLANQDPDQGDKTSDNQVITSREF
jgi:RHS repeat-associated protein